MKDIVMAHVAITACNNILYKSCLCKKAQSHKSKKYSRHEYEPLFQCESLSDQ